MPYALFTQEQLGHGKKIKCELTLDLCTTLLIDYPLPLYRPLYQGGLLGMTGNNSMALVESTEL